MLRIICGDPGTRSLRAHDRYSTIDVDGVLQYADGPQWRLRLEAEAFLEWAVGEFDCRWLTA